MAAPNSIHMFAPANHDALRIEKPSTGPLHLINRAQQFAFEGFALAAIAKGHREPGDELVRGTSNWP